VPWAGALAARPEPGVAGSSSGDQSTTGTIEDGDDRGRATAPRRPRFAKFCKQRFAKQFVVHPELATLAAQAACAADRQGSYPQMERLLWEKGYKDNRNFSPAKIDALTAEAGLDLARFKTDLQGDCPKRVREEQQRLAAFGVSSTPSFFINGRFLLGAQPKENFERLIDEELKKADEAIKQGTRPEELYAETVLKPGKKGL
jgi:predicted DsbA family dithiol-disulfide isomerase